MRFDPKKLNALSVRLHGRQIGVITRLAGDRQLFAFEQDYIDDPQRPTLSLSFKGSTGGLVTTLRPVGAACRPSSPTFCPKGTCATISPKRADVNPEREFFLLAVLGADLPGALVVAPLEGDEHAEGPPMIMTMTITTPRDEPSTVFSRRRAAEVLRRHGGISGGLTIPADGMGGSWIVKLPSARFAAVPENEFAMLRAGPPRRHLVPDNRSSRLAVSRDCPKRPARSGSRALAVQRFDRRPADPFTWRISRKSSGSSPTTSTTFDSYANIAVRAVGETGEDAVARIRPAPCILRRDRQRRHAPQELVPPLSRRADAGPLAGL